MNWNTLFSHLPLSALIAWALSVGIPYLSALATRGPRHLTGVITAVLALVDGFLWELTRQGADHYNVGSAAGLTFLAWLTATKWHSKVLAGTKPEARLYAFPRKATEPQVAPATTAAAA